MYNRITIQHLVPGKRDYHIEEKPAFQVFYRYFLSIVYDLIVSVFITSIECKEYMQHEEYKDGPLYIIKETIHLAYKLHDIITILRVFGKLLCLPDINLQVMLFRKSQVYRNENELEEPAKSIKNHPGQMKSALWRKYWNTIQTRRFSNNCFRGYYFVPICIIIL